MATSTTDRINVGMLSADTANALWAAMHEDDDLAAVYLDLCLVNGLSMFTEGRWGRALTREGWRKLVTNLEAARIRLRAEEEEFVSRWYTYAEPPF